MSYFGDSGADDIEDVMLDLRVGVGECVEGGVHLVDGQISKNIRISGENKIELKYEKFRNNLKNFFLIGPHRE